ncbi:ComEC/Rec2 family competence protein [Roseimicrobium gellanilyticum]|uniref:ComEC/Rec2 family competence protein n=1 Tax=Roseimicrobium gellanilyticum TaxID=748857 RepID=UPI001B871B88|nr:ComEC/Rec2 family competence protein [Roseimicrobium gellanilyticum]
MDWSQKIRARPLVLLALSAVAGICLTDALPPLGGKYWFLPALAAVFALWLLRSARLRWALVLAALSFAALHHTTLQSTRDHPVRGMLAHHGASMHVQVEGEVQRALRSDLPGAQPWEALFIADHITCSPLGKSFDGPTRLHLLTGSRVPLKPGRYRIVGRMQLPPWPDNPGEFDRRTYDLRRGLTAQLRATEVTLLQEDRFPVSATLVAAAERCRAWVTDILSVDLEDRPDERTIILAMALGTMQSDARDLQIPFRESGTLHVFAVSGLHVVIVGGILLALLRPFVRNRTALCLLLIGALFGYAFLTGLKPSAVRATVMMAVVFAGTMLNRHGDLLNTLGGAALLLLVFDTNQIFAAGFQLSFGVLASIGIFAAMFPRPFHHWVDPDPFLPKPLLTGTQKLLWRVRRESIGLVTVSAAAWIGSLPLIFHHFHLVTPVSIAANMLLVPLSFAVLGTAILTLITGALHLTWIQVLLSNANLAFAWCTLHSAQFFADVPGGNFYVPHATLGPQPPAEMHVLRLPDGAAAQLIRIGDHNWLFDCGREGNYPFILRPCLQHLGLNRLHGLVLSHNDVGHIGAALKVQRDFGSPAVFLSAREPWRWDPGLGTMRQLHKAGLQGQALQWGDSIALGSFSDGSAVKARVLFPTDDVWPRRADDRTLVLRIEVGPHRILWCNDAGFIAEKKILETTKPEDLQCSILIRNQHASDFALLPEFLDAVRPQLIITSSDTFPAEPKLPLQTLEYCTSHGIRILNQESTGSTLLRIWPDRIGVRPFHDDPSFPIIPHQEAGP